jgi:hypothetical protein
MRIRQIFGDNLLPQTEAELIAIAKAELKAHADYPGTAWSSPCSGAEIPRNSVPAPMRRRQHPGYPECVAMLVQVGDHLGMQYDLKG